MKLHVVDLVILPKDLVILPKIRSINEVNSL